MNLFLFIIINGSIFSIDGIGEDLSAFKTPFLGELNKAQIEFTISPEFDILNQGWDLRSIFWTNPFSFATKIPLGKGYTVALGNSERFNQAFDLYLEDELLDIHLVSKGGVEELHFQFNKTSRLTEIAFGGSYLFGGAQEIWDYHIGDYFTVDTFLYKYRGQVFYSGLKISLFSISYEGFGNLTMTKKRTDITLDIPERLSIGIAPEFKANKFNILFEHSFWTNYNSPYRFIINFSRRNIALSYLFNPWYLDGVQEHGLISSCVIPIKKIGFCILNLRSCMKTKDSLREFRIIPEFRLTLEEIFARRRK